MAEPETRHIAGPTYPRKDFYYTQCKHCSAKTPEGEPEVHIEGCTAAAHKSAPPELPLDMVFVPREVLNLYEFMRAAFSPMTGQQLEIQKTLDLATNAIKLMQQHKDVK